MKFASIFDTEKKENSNPPLSSKFATLIQYQNGEIKEKKCDLPDYKKTIKKYEQIKQQQQNKLKLEKIREKYQLKASNFISIFDPTPSEFQIHGTNYHLQEICNSPKKKSDSQDFKTQRKKHKMRILKEKLKTVHSLTKAYPKSIESWYICNKRNELSGHEAQTN